MRRSALSGYVDVVIIEYAAHIAYLDPQTGTGYLVTPHPDSDVDAPSDPLVGAVWSDSLQEHGNSASLSLHAADRRGALHHLGRQGWEFLYDEEGEIEQAGRTADGRLALCLYGEPPTIEPCLESLSRSLMALDIAAGLTDRPHRYAGDQTPTTE